MPRASFGRKAGSPAKELIKPGGENVYPAEVEREIAAHPTIAEVVVFGVPDAQWGEAIKAVCVCKPGLTVTAQQIVDFVGGRSPATSAQNTWNSWVRCLKRQPARSIAPRSKGRRPGRHVARLESPLASNAGGGIGPQRFSFSKCKAASMAETLPDLARRGPQREHHRPFHSNEELRRNGAGLALRLAG